MAKVLLVLESTNHLDIKQTLCLCFDQDQNVFFISAKVTTLQFEKLSDVSHVPHVMCQAFILLHGFATLKKTKSVTYLHILGTVPCGVLALAHE